MNMKALITAAAIGIAVPVLATPAFAGETKENLKETGRDIKDTAKSAAAGTKQQTKEAVLTTKVKTALAAENDLNSLKIHVDSEGDGIVTLTGKVKTQAQLQQAEAATKAVEGVVEVRNKLEVRS